MQRFEFLKKIKLPKLKRPSVGQFVFWGITFALAIGGFILARNMTECWKITDLPGISLPTCSGGVGGVELSFTPEAGTPIALPPPTPVVVPEAVLPPAWDGASRINILFFGLDYRDWQANEGPPRTDTMILFTIDPVSKKIGMLSIPRDMWVNIPSFGYGRINMAYPDGEGAKLPGGGAALAMKTVEQFIGVPVHYYAQVDFGTFAEFIDYLGGVDPWVEETLTLDPVGPGVDHFKVKCCGYRHMNGWRTLAYARTRKTGDGDIDRARRQQWVIYAIQKKVFDPKVFPSLIGSAPAIYAQFQSGIHTNMPFEDAVRLAVLGKDVSLEGVQMGVIDTTMVTFDNVMLGGQNASIMKPLADKIRVLRDEIFTTSGPLSPMAQGDPVSLMRAEEARVRIVDGTFTPGLDQRAGTLFQSQGMNVLEVGPASEFYSSTVVVVYGPKIYTLKYMQSAFGITSNQIRFNPDPNSTVDIEIRLGTDLAGVIP
jgi:LCP family protein required for cell wall assembly